MLATRISFMKPAGQPGRSARRGILKPSARASALHPRHRLPIPYLAAAMAGSRFPKDVKALARTADEHGLPLRVISAVEAANDAQAPAGRQIIARFGATSPAAALPVGPGLQAQHRRYARSAQPDADRRPVARGATVAAWTTRRRAYEAARALAGRPGIRFADSMQSALDGADALAIVTEWKEFRSPEFADLKARLRTPAIFDGRRMYDLASVREAGLEYHAIGRP